MTPGRDEGPDDRPAPFDADAIPADLKAVGRWIVWNRTIRDGKPDKPPIDYRTGRPGDVRDPEIWLAFRSAAERRDRFDGIGFVFHEEDDLCGVDLDHCFDDDGELEPWAERIVEGLQSYTERSPSGRGLHVIVRGKLPAGGNKRTGFGPDGKGAVEMYDRARYFTVTGDHRPGTPTVVEDRAEELAAFHREIFPPREQPGPRAESNGHCSLDDETLLAKARLAWNGARFRSLYDDGDITAYHGDWSRGDLALCAHLAFWTGGDAEAIDRLFRASALHRPKWDEMRGPTQTYGQRTIARALQGMRGCYNPTGFRSQNTSQKSHNSQNGRSGHGQSIPGRSGVADSEDSEDSETCSDSGDWPSPVLDGPTPALAFPVDVLPRGLAEMICYAADSMGCAIDYPALASLAVASGAIGRSFAIRLKPGWTESALLYVAGVGDPGTTKSPAITLMAQILWSIAKEKLTKYQGEMKDHRSGDGPAPTLQRIVVEDTTVEALAPMLRDNPRGLLMVRDELTALFAGHNQYKRGRGADRQFYLSNWSGAPINVDRKSNPDGIPIHIPHPYLAIVGGLTPGMLSELSEAKGRDDGFLDRILFGFPEPTRVRWCPDGIPDDVNALWQQAVRRLLAREMVHDEGGDRPFFVGFSRDALERFVAWFDGHCEETEADDFSPHLKGMWAKFRAYCARLALILDRLHRAFWDEDWQGPVDISARNLEGAIQLIDYFKAHGRRVRSLMRGAFGENPDARALILWLIKFGHREFSERDARQNFRKRFPVDGPELSDALKWLESRHCIRPKGMPPREGPGRPPSSIYEVNPALFRESPGTGPDHGRPPDDPPHDATEYLHGYLVRGRHLISEIIANARTVGILEADLRAAADRLGLETTYDGEQPCWSFPGRFTP